MLQISATILAIFLIFGAVLLKTGGGEAFLDIAFLASARTRGGQAKVAAVASCLFGMISGSAVADAATIGTFTIPLMKRAGFSKEFAAATEAVAGTGGQIMPPVMGAGAFLIAQFLGISYAKVAWAAVLPALLYYAGLIVSIHLEAVKNDFPTIPMEEERLFRARLTAKKVILPLIPVAALVLAFSAGYTVQMVPTGPPSWRSPLPSSWWRDARGSGYGRCSRSRWRAWRRRGRPSPRSPSCSPPPRSSLPCWD